MAKGNTNKIKYTGPTSAVDLGADEVELAIRDLVISQDEPFYGQLLAKFQHKRVTKSDEDGAKFIPTAAVAMVKNDIVLFINEEFFKGLEPLERVAVLKHECQHIAHRHLTRGAADQGFKQERANIAMDAAINQMNDNLPPDLVDFKKIKGAIPMDSWEHYYALIPDTDQDKLQELFGKMVGDHSMWGDVDDETNPEMVDELVKSRIREAAEQVGIGNLPEEVHGILAEINAEAKIDWRTVLRSWMQEAINRYRDYLPFRESRVVTGIFPGMHYKPAPEFDIYVDASGSIGDQDFNDFATEVLEINKTLHATVNLHQFDTMIHKSEKIERQVPTLERVAHGGTNFSCILKHAWDNRIRNIIIMTDGYAEEVDQTGYNILWVYTKEHHKHPGKFVILED